MIDAKTQALPALRPHIRWLIRRDMPEALAIEAASFEAPWAEEDFLRCLRDRNVIGMAAERGDRVLGYMIYELKEGELELLNMAVCPKHRRQGVGSHLVARLISNLSVHRRACLTAVVRETNVRAQHFLARCGLRAERVLRRHYEDTREDGYLMRYALEVPG